MGSPSYRPVAATTRPAPSLSSLPFVVCEPGRLTGLWVVEPSGDWPTDCATGRAHAAALIAFMAADGNTQQMGHIIRAIGQAGQWTGVEVGFCQAIADAAVSAWS